MIVSRQKWVRCPFCGHNFILREYVGLEGGLYGDHFCEERRAAIINDDTDVFTELPWGAGRFYLASEIKI